MAPTGGGRYLSGDLSYFGVGSKNAAFFMGRSVKVATKQAASAYVHELCITAAELERRCAPENETVFRVCHYHARRRRCAYLLARQPAAEAHGGFVA